MFEIKMTINGKPMTEANIKNEIDLMMFDAVVEEAKKSVTSALTQEEASQITINHIGHNIENLSLEVKGPEAILAKDENALSE